jgi:hypothetical protein
MTTPTAIIGGAPKCGTTSLFDWLAAHPAVCAASVKETRYFLDRTHPLFDARSNWATTGRAGYERYFAHCRPGAGRVVIEATPAYINQQTALAFVPSLRPQPLLIFSLRRPSARIYSMFQYARNALGVLPARMSFEQFLRLEAAAEQSPAGRVAALAFDQSRYAHHLARWIERCGRQNVAVVLFESLRRDAAGVMAALSARLAIDPLFWQGFAFERKNEARRIRWHGLHRALKRAVTLLPPAVRLPAARRLYYRAIAGAGGGVAAADRALLAALDERFAPEQEALARLLDLDLSLWESAAP